MVFHQLTGQEDSSPMRVGSVVKIGLAFAVCAVLFDLLVPWRGPVDRDEATRIAYAQLARAHDSLKQRGIDTARLPPPTIQLDPDTKTLLYEFWDSAQDVSIVVIVKPY